MITIPIIMIMITRRPVIKIINIDVITSMVICICISSSSMIVY